MSSILPEILFHILECGYYIPPSPRRKIPPGTPNYKYLKACALVCRAWSGPAQSLLFRSVLWLHSRNIHAFHTALLSSAARGRALGGCVQTLDMTISPVSQSSLAIHHKLNIPVCNTQGCSPLVAVVLLQACPHIHELVLSLYGVNLDQEALEKLKVAGQRLESLSLACHGSQPLTPFNLLRIWPNIRFLKIRSYLSLPWYRTGTSPTPQSVSDTRELADKSVAQISLYHLALTTTIEPDALAWLLASSVDSLCILDLQVPLHLRERNMFARHVHSLRSLHLSEYGENIISLLRLCTSLEELVFRGFRLPPRCPLASNLPPTIQRLTFTIWTYKCRVTLQPIIDAVDTLPNLKVLRCNQNMRDQHHEEYATLEWRCKRKGAEFILSDRWD